ncbi:MAG: hypothetical protein IT435_19300 [Phycisphaerales bacterium]|nr:hypothetical protein [Phycisphaerales bacterium]
MRVRDESLKMALGLEPVELLVAPVEQPEFLGDRGDQPVRHVELVPGI